ncbi:hypothetical protein [uncultured Gimesia sp.]|jgi:hypothetical protein|uniref:hypothetical protein n=1 Tax=uncultured Gimesia sp. TaxID=1678688 RepID=UPI00262243C0|nr:hypothetical protein [uncultured Gimesia sp.]
MIEISDNSTPSNSSDHLDWFAFQYLSNELSEQESQAFEALLAQKQEAREALASAVQLIAGLKSIEPIPVLNSETASIIQPEFKSRSLLASRLQRWALAGCAVVLLLAAVSLLLPETSFRNSTDFQTVQIEPSQDDLKHLLNLWSEAAEDSSFTVSLISGTEQLDLIDQPNILAENQTLEIPDWLYTAVSLPEESVN